MTLHSPRINVRLPAELHEALAETARGEGIELSTLIRRVLARHVFRYRKDRSLREAAGKATWATRQRREGEATTPPAQ